MTLKFSIDYIEKNIRSKDKKGSLKNSAIILFGEYIETIETRIKVTGVPSAGCADVNLSLDYFEEYDRNTVIGDFEDRALAFAKEWCDSIGLLKNATQ